MRNKGIALRTLGFIAVVVSALGLALAQAKFDAWSHRSEAAIDAFWQPQEIAAENLGYSEHDRIEMTDLQRVVYFAGNPILGKR